MRNLTGELQPKTLIVAGGVACNGALREAVSELGEEFDLPVYFPSKHLSTDNAAMIAAAGFYHLQNGERADLEMTADVTMRLQNFENEDGELKRKKSSLSFVEKTFSPQRHRGTEKIIKKSLCLCVFVVNFLL
jgi:hypothetical protein